MTKRTAKSSRRSRPAKHCAASRPAAAKQTKIVSAKLPLPKANRAERAAERRQAIIEAAMEEFIGVQQRLSNSEDAAEGVRSFVETRPARFTGR